jgi:hypothetical protein
VSNPLSLGGAQNDALIIAQNSSTQEGARSVVGVMSSTLAGSSSAAVRGENKSTSGSGIGVWGSQNGAGWGVLGTAVDGFGVNGTVSGTTGFNTGIWGQSPSINGRGVVGYSTALSGNNAFGVVGQCDSTGGSGVYGYVPYGTGSSGVLGRSDGENGTGVKGVADEGLSNAGVWGETLSGYGVYGSANGFYGVAVYGVTPPGGSSAGHFQGQLYATFATATVKAFRIDHPLDPENQYLQHSSVESPDMKNVYDGVATLDGDGSSWVALPNYFEALNRDFRYQLTALGGPGPMLHVAEEIAGNRFRIAGGMPGMRVSWQITGIRHDPAADLNRIEVELPKAERHRGLYLVPEAYGLPRDRTINLPPRALLDQDGAAPPFSNPATANAP